MSLYLIKWNNVDMLQAKHVFFFYFRFKLFFFFFHVNKTVSLDFSQNIVLKEFLEDMSFYP